MHIHINKQDLLSKNLVTQVIVFHLKEQGNISIVIRDLLNKLSPNQTSEKCYLDTSLKWSPRHQKGI